jgi:hypothetical protein
MCWRCPNEIPILVRRRLECFRRVGIHEVQKIVTKVDPPLFIDEEVPATHHGLKFVSQSHSDHVKQKAILDIGAFNGSSAIVFANYAWRVYRLELSPKGFRDMLPVLNQTGNYTKNVIPVLAGVGENETTTYVSLTTFYAGAAWTADEYYNN